MLGYGVVDVPQIQRGVRVIGRAYRAQSATRDRE
jgi:hypothetical protein